MKIPFIDKALTVVHLLNGEGAGRDDIKYLGILGVDIATLRLLTVR